MGKKHIADEEGVPEQANDVSGKCAPISGVALVEVTRASQKLPRFTKTA